MSTVPVDAEMQAAESRGQATLGLFVESFQDPEDRWTAFQVRYTYTTEMGYRSAVWLNLESVDQNGAFVGTVPEDEDPRTIPFEPGQRLTVQQTDINDWMFIDGRGRWYGGYTLRVALDRSLGTGNDSSDNIHGGTEFMDLDNPNDPGS